MSGKVKPSTRGGMNDNWMKNKQVIPFSFSGEWSNGWAAKLIIWPLFGVGYFGQAHKYFQNVVVLQVCLKEVSCGVVLSWCNH